MAPDNFLEYSATSLCFPLSPPYFCWESQCGLVNISSGHARASVETEQSVTPERMPTFPLDVSTVPCRGRRRAVLSPTSAPWQLAHLLSLPTMLKRGRDSWGRKGRVVLGDALTFQPSKTSRVGQDSFTLPLKHQLPKGRQGLFLTPKGLKEELWMLAGDRQGNGFLPCGHEAGVQYQSLWKGDRCPFLTSSNVVCTFSSNLNLGVQSEEPVWKNLFLFQERARKIFVLIIKVEI